MSGRIDRCVYMVSCELGLPNNFCGVEAGTDQSLVSQLVHRLLACLLDQRDASMHAVISDL